VISPLQGVGQNLWDPIFFNVLFGVTTPSTGVFISSPTSLTQYLTTASGPYSSAGGYFALEKLPSGLRKNLSNTTTAILASYPQDWPEIQHAVSGFPGGPNFTIGSISPTLILPSSRGNVTITSPNMADPPELNLNWLATPSDTSFAILALKRARQIWNTTSALKIRVGAEIAPGENVQSDEDILEYVRNTGQTTWHASSTCKMGREGDEGAVVDSKGRVYGVSGLRVVDASVFPFGVPSNPQGTLYGLAEKIAEDVKNGR
jgi:choline dehydrogenase